MNRYLSLLYNHTVASVQSSILIVVSEFLNKNSILL